MLFIVLHLKLFKCSTRYADRSLKWVSILATSYTWAYRQQTWSAYTRAPARNVNVIVIIVSRTLNSIHNANNNNKPLAMIT